MTQKTILNDTHRALGAKMVDFGGWDMPLHYGSQVDEHHLVRRDARGTRSFEQLPAHRMRAGDMCVRHGVASVCRVEA